MDDSDSLLGQFDLAIKLPKLEQARYLDWIGAGDPERRRKLDDLIRGHESLIGEESRARPLEPSQGEMPGDLATSEDTGENMPRIGRYQTIRLLGEGGQGKVYEAVQDVTGQRVALKVFFVSGLSVSATQARFRREMEILGQLAHPTIVRVLDAETTSESVYCAMELVRGGMPLDKYVAAGKLKPRAAITLFAKVCEAVAHAHRQGVIHRDLKPANLLVGADGIPKVIDFGLARLLEQDSASPTITRTGQVLGTLIYMSPEQISGATHDLEPTTDVYSLGVVLYKILTGDHPYPTTSDTSKLRETITNELPRRPRSRLKVIDVDVETIIMKALEKKPGRRYPDAGALHADLERYLAGDAILARPQRFYRLRKAARRAWHRLDRRTVLRVLTLAVLAATYLSHRLWTEMKEAEWRGLTEKVDKKVASVEAGRTDDALELIDAARHWRVDSGLRRRAAAVLGQWDSRAIPLEHEEQKPKDAIVWSVSLDPGGKLLAAGTPGGIAIWELPSGRMLTPLDRWAESHGEGGAVAFSPDGRYLAAGAPAGGAGIEVHSVLATGTLGPPEVVAVPRPSAVGFSPDGHVLAASFTCKEGSPPTELCVRLWNASGSRFVEQGAMSEARAFAFSPDSQHIAVGLGEGLVDVYDLSDLSSAKLKINTAQRDLDTLAWHPRAPVLAAGSVDGSVALVDLKLHSADGGLTMFPHTTRWSAHGFGVGCLAFAPGGEWLATGGWNRSASLWDPSGGSKLTHLDALEVGHYTRTLSVSRDGSLLAAGGKNGVTVCRVRSPIGQWSRKSGNAQIERIVFDSQGIRFAALSHDWYVTVWEVQTGRRCAELRAGFSKFVDNSSVVFSPSGQLLACASFEGVVELWSWPEAKRVCKWSLQQWAAYGICPRLAFLSENELILLRHERGGEGENVPWRIRAYDLARDDEVRLRYDLTSSGREVFDASPLHTHDAPPTGQETIEAPGARKQVLLCTWLGPAFPPDERKLRLFDVLGGRQIWEWQPPRLREEKGAAVVPMSTDGRFINAGRWSSGAEGGSPNSSLLMRVSSEGLTPYREAPLLGGHPSPNGRWLARQMGGNLVYLWDTRTKSDVFELPNLVGTVSALEFSPTGTHLACAAEDAIQCFDLEQLRTELEKIGVGW